MADQPTTQPSVTEAQLNAVMVVITDKLGGVFVTPSAIEPILESMVNENNALAPIANTVWDIAQRMHKQTGEALTLVAMQKAMMDELHAQRNFAISKATIEGWDNGFKDGLHASEEMREEWQFTFFQGVADNEIEGLEEEQVLDFAEIFYEGRLDDTAKKMLYDLIIYVHQKYVDELAEVDI